MQYQLLGRSGVRASRIALGTALLGLAPSGPDAEKLVHAAIDHGINVFDCANTYGNRPAFDRPGLPPASERRYAEEVLGEALRGRRDDVLVCTKVGEPVGDGVNDGGLTIPGQVNTGGGLSRFHIMREVDRSLTRLGTDHIDIYHLHHPDPDTPILETLDTLDSLVQQGKIRYVGLSDHLGWQMTQAVMVADSHSLPRPILNQIHYNMISRGPEVEVVPAASELGVSLTCFSPLAGGALAGAEVLDRSHAGMKRFGVPFAFTDTQRRVAVELSGLARRWGVAPAHLAMQWLWSRPGVATAIIGPESVDELDSAVEAFGVTLDAEQFAELDSVGRVDIDPW
ncbi:hypothetical protein B1964_28470 [Gordonia sp. i37]|nr:aldo/keto reductase [Gordonia sp. i37]OPX06675.1 hypothetical protein B1964_28470 [Gordonia sp. i37]